MVKERKLQLNTVLAAMDAKDRDFYDNLDDDQKKEFSGYLLLRYSSSVVGSPELQNYYVASTNHYANKHMFDLSKHPKLQWLMLTAASPGIGNQRHSWLKQKPKTKDSNNEIKKELLEIYPMMKDADLDVLASITTKKDIKEYMDNLGE